MLKRAVDRTEKIDMESLQDELISGSMQLWVSYESAANEIIASAVTERVTYTSGIQSARILLLGGFGMTRFLGGIATIEKWARLEGCDLVEVVGRRGWERVLGGYEPIETWLSKEIS